MAKIINVELTDKGYQVTYDSGSTKSYKEAPKTVMAFLEAQEPVTAAHTEKAPESVQEAPEAPTTVKVEGSTQEALQEAVKAPERAQAPMVSKEAPEAVMVTEKEAHQAPVMVKAALQTVMVTEGRPPVTMAHHTVKAPMVVVHTVKAKPIIDWKVVMDILWLIADKASLVWFALTTLVLIGFDKAMAHKDEGLRATRRAFKAVMGFAWGILKGGLAWGLVVVLVGVGGAKAITHSIKAGWTWRAESLSEVA